MVSVKLAPSSARNAPVLPRVQNVKTATSSASGTSVIPRTLHRFFLETGIKDDLSSRSQFRIVLVFGLGKPPISDAWRSQHHLQKHAVRPLLDAWQLLWGKLPYRTLCPSGKCPWRFLVAHFMRRLSPHVLWWKSQSWFTWGWRHMPNVPGELLRVQQCRGLVSQVMAKWPFFFWQGVGYDSWSWSQF